MNVTQSRLDISPDITINKQNFIKVGQKTSDANQSVYLENGDKILSPYTNKYKKNYVVDEYDHRLKNINHNNSETFITKKASSKQPIESNTIQNNHYKAPEFSPITPNESKLEKTADSQKPGSIKTITQSEYSKFNNNSLPESPINNGISRKQGNRVEKRTPNRSRNPNSNSPISQNNKTISTRNDAKNNLKNAGKIISISDKQKELSKYESPYFANIQIQNPINDYQIINSSQINPANPQIITQLDNCKSPSRKKILEKTNAIKNQNSKTQLVPLDSLNQSPNKTKIQTQKKQLNSVTARSHVHSDEKYHNTDNIASNFENENSNESYSSRCHNDNSYRLAGYEISLDNDKKMSPGFKNNSRSFQEEIEYNTNNFIVKAEDFSTFTPKYDKSVKIIDKPKYVIEDDTVRDEKFIKPIPKVIDEVQEHFYLSGGNTTRDLIILEGETENDLAELKKFRQSSNNQWKDEEIDYIITIDSDQTGNNTNMTKKQSNHYVNEVKVNEKQIMDS